MNYRGTPLSFDHHRRRDGRRAFSTRPAPPPVASNMEAGTKFQACSASFQAMSFTFWLFASSTDLFSSPFSFSFLLSILFPLSKASSSDLYRTSFFSEIRRRRATFSQITLLLLLFRSFPPSQEASSLSHHRPLFFLLSIPLSRTPGLAALPFPFRPFVRSCCGCWTKFRDERCVSVRYKLQAR